MFNTCGREVKALLEHLATNQLLIKEVVMEDFKYGDRVEVRNEDHLTWCLAKFIAVDEWSKYKFVAHEDGCASAHAYAQCRHARPDLKPGQPVVVWSQEMNLRGRKYIRLFVSWDDSRDVIMAKGIDSKAVPYCKYALLKNYAYSAPVEEF